MKKIIIIFVSLLLLTGCTWKYQEKVIIEENIEQKSPEQLLLEQKRAEEIMEQIKNEEDDKMSAVLEDFLQQKDIDIKKELLNTQNRYNDLLGPILIYEHEKVEETQTGSTQSGVTNSGSIITQTGSADNIDGGDVIAQTGVYSGEVKINSENINNILEKNDIITVTEIKKEIKEEKYITETKKGRSGSYTSYKGTLDTCKGGLKMVNNSGAETWLFLNSCEKKIYSFELAVGGIKVTYLDQKGNKKTEFVSINK